MKSNLFIPTKLKIGFQERHDTFTGKLAYVIYYDEKGKLRKETSWNQWRDDSIDVVEIDNTPTSGFTMNKGFTRYSDWGSGRAVIRIWDPRDFEFEIALDNLVGILMHSNVSKREIDEKCVFAWNGTELVLLPCNTEEYQSSVKYTEKQAKTFSAKTLVPGYTYIPKKEDKPVIYLGRYEHYQEKGYFDDRKVIKAKGKKHWFINIDGTTAFAKEPSAYLAGIDSEEVHSDFASKLEALHSTPIVQKIVGFKELPYKLDKSQSCSYSRNFYVKHKDDIYIEYNIPSLYYLRSPFLIEAERLVRILPDGTVERDYRERSTYYYSYQRSGVEKRLSPFNLTLNNISYKKPGYPVPEDLKNCSYYNMTDAQKESYERFVQGIMDAHFPDAVTLVWVLENGKETKGLNYEY